MSNRNQRPPQKRTPDYVGLVFTALLSISGTIATLRSDWWDFEAASQEADVSQVSLLYDRIALLETQREIATQLILEDKLKIVMLEAQLEGDINPLSALFKYIERIETPAWVKLYYPDDGEFRMLYINSDYELAFDVSKERYVGSTDAEIHNSKAAAEYKRNDFKVLRDRDFKSFIEYGPNIDGEVYRMRYWKFYIRLADGRELVAGIQVGRVDEGY